MIFLANECREKVCFPEEKKSKLAKSLLQSRRFNVLSPQKSSVTGFVRVYLCMKVEKKEKNENKKENSLRAPRKIERREVDVEKKSK
jgi:hypothetical protein